MHSALLAGPIVNLTIFFSFAAAIFFLLGVGPHSFSPPPPSLAEKQLYPPAKGTAGQYFTKIQKHQENVRKTKDSGKC